LPLEFTKTARKRSLVERVFRLSMAVLLMIGADFLHFALILAHYWRLLPTERTQNGFPVPIYPMTSSKHTSRITSLIYP
jgi:hypothetical protein